MLFSCINRQNHRALYHVHTLKPSQVHTLLSCFALTDNTHKKPSLLILCSLSMASSRVVLSCLVFLLLTLCLVECRQVLELNASEVSKPGSINCGGACAARCQQSSRPNLCNRACGTCCSRCSCVPSGTYGNYDSCPCYRDMTTRGGQRKCP